MKYLELVFTLTPYDSDAADLLAALAGQAGLESFVGTGSGLKGYVRPSCFHRDLLDDTLAAFPFPAVKVTYSVCEAEDRNWNEEWEKQGFEPVCIDGKICIHQPGQSPLPPAEHYILIEPHQAFGTGQHQTTSMILRRLADMDLEGKKVLDAGCGTGILSIFCAQKGASRILAYDIDSWSVRNTRQNMRLNDISRMELPPGFRGYGVKNYIENPESAKRQAEVDQIRARMEAEGADRWAIQNAIMPYQDLLPKRLRGRNERIGEPLTD